MYFLSPLINYWHCSQQGLYNSMVSIHLFVYLSVHLSLFHLLAAAVWGGFVAVNLVDRRCRSIMSGAGRCSSTAYSNMAFRSKCEQFHVCRQGTRLNTDCLLSYSLLYFYFYFVIGMSGRAFSLYLSSWHSLLERSHVHNWMRVFWRCCLLPHIGRTGVKWSQVRFNGSGPHVVGSSWRSFPVWWMLENHSSNCTVMVLDDGRAFSQTQSHYTSTPITHPPLDSVWPDHGGHGPDKVKVKVCCISKLWCSLLSALLFYCNLYSPKFPLLCLTVVPSVLWRCWLGGRKGIRPVKNEWWGAGVVICLEQGADLHMA